MALAVPCQLVPTRTIRPPPWAARPLPPRAGFGYTPGQRLPRGFHANQPRRSTKRKLAISAGVDCCCGLACLDHRSARSTVLGPGGPECIRSPRGDPNRPFYSAPATSTGSQFRRKLGTLTHVPSFALVAPIPFVPCFARVALLRFGYTQLTAQAVGPTRCSQPATSAASTTSDTNAGTSPSQVKPTGCARERAVHSGHTQRFGQMRFVLGRTQAGRHG
jgi:hypothetical protein